jgi:peroxiredoxin
VAMFPHERSLVKKMEGKPFVLLGVNGDDNDTPEEVKKKNDAQQITWRSFKNNRGGKGSTIAEEWGLEGWPTLYVIDAKGVIRHKWVGSPGNEVLDKAIEELVKEAESAGGKKS